MANTIWARSGKLIIGTKDKPIPKNNLVEIIFCGNSKNEYIVINNDVDQINKGIMLNN